MTNDEFLKRLKDIFGDEYDFSKTVFVNWRTKVMATCTIHGDFLQLPGKLLYCKSGCGKCKGLHISQAKRSTQEDFLRRCAEVHGDEYDYSKAIYQGSDVKVEIICRKHGSFFQTPYTHIKKGCGCPMCRYERLSENYRLKIDELYQRFGEIHNNFYTYPKLEKEYVNNRSLITIVCPIHGEFKQRAMKHLKGHGCPKCNQSKMEKQMKSFLVQHQIEFEEQKKFEWLVWTKHLSVDFYLPKYGLAIECQGEQHFTPIQAFGGQEEFVLIQKRDEMKFNLCTEHGIKLLYFSNCKKLPQTYYASILTDEETLLDEIFKYSRS